MKPVQGVVGVGARSYVSAVVCSRATLPSVRAHETPGPGQYVSPVYKATGPRAHLSGGARSALRARTNWHCPPMFHYSGLLSIVQVVR